MEKLSRHETQKKTDAVNQLPPDQVGGCRVECRGTIYANTSVEIDGEHLLLTDDYARSGVRLTDEGGVSPLQ